MKNLKKLLDNNCNVVIKRDDGHSSLFVPLKDIDGDYRNSDLESTIEEAKRSDIAKGAYTKDEIEERSKQDNWQIVEVYRNTPTPLAAGTKVKILDSIKDTYDWNSFKDVFPEMKGVIACVYNCVAGLSYDIESDGTATIGAEYIIPDTEEKNTMPAVDEMKKLFDNFCADADKLIKK